MKAYLMNPLKNLKLRTKLIASFVLLIGMSALLFFVGTQLAFEQITDDAIPTLRVTGQISKLAKTIQAETLEFVSSGEAETVAQFKEDIGQLDALAAQLENELSDDENEESAFQRLAGLTQQVSTLGDEIIQTHQQTLKLIAQFQEIDLESETVLAELRQVIEAEIARNVEAGNFEELARDAVPSQQYFEAVVSDIQVFRIEALQFIVSGEAEEALTAFDMAETRLEQAQANLAKVIEADEPGEADFNEKLNDIEERIENQGRAIIEAHTETLELLNNLEEIEQELDAAIAEAEQLANKDVSESVEIANRNIALAIGLVLAFATLIGLFLANAIVRPVAQLAEAAGQVGAGQTISLVQTTGQDEIGVLARTFNTMAQQVRDLVANLEERVQERTRSLEASTRVSRQLSTILDPDELMQQVVSSIQDTFGYYHVHIYLLDENGGELLMREGTGAVGEQLKAKGHKLKVGQGIVGRVAGSGQAFLAGDVDQVPNFFRNPLLPDTKAELAVPLRRGERILGVLDAQSNETDGFTQDDLALMQAIADQIAVAIDNARLFQESQTAVAQAEALNRQLTRAAWQNISDKVEKSSYALTKFGPVSGSEAWVPTMDQAVRQRSLVRSNGQGNGSHSPEMVGSVAIPLMLRGETIGVIGLERPADQPWSEDELAAIQRVTEQVALALEAARLAGETKRAAWRDHIVSESTAEVWSAAEIEAVMKTAVAQLGNKLGASEVVLRLGTEEELVEE